MEFLKSQHDYTRSVLDSLGGRNAMLARIQQLDNAAPTVRSWLRGGNNIFYLETPPARAPLPCWCVRSRQFANAVGPEVA